MLKQKKALILTVIALALTVTGAFAWKPLIGPYQINNNGTPASTSI